MTSLLWLSLGAVSVAAVWWFGPRWLAPPDDLGHDEPTEEVPPDTEEEGLGVVDANTLGSFLGSTLPDLAPPETGEEEREEE